MKEFRDKVKQLKRSLAEASIKKSNILMSLMIPYLESKRKSELEESLLRLNDEIRRLTNKSVQRVRVRARVCRRRIAQNR